MVCSGFAIMVDLLPTPAAICLGIYPDLEIMHSVSAVVCAYTIPDGALDG